MKMGLLLIFASVFFAAVVRAGIETRPVFQYTFYSQIPADWQISGFWTAGATGAKAEGACTAVWNGRLPESALIEIVIDLPEKAGLEKTASVSLSAGNSPDDPNMISASSVYGRSNFQATISGTNDENKKVSISASGDTRPSVWLEKERAKGKEKDMSAQHPGWASTTVSLGLVLRQNDCRLLINGSESCRAGLRVPAERKLFVRANNVTVRSIRVLPAPSPGYAYITGSSIALLSGGLSKMPMTGISGMEIGTSIINVLGVPMLVQVSENKIITLDVGAEQWAGQAWSEGIGFLKAPVPARIYSSAYLLLHDENSPDSQSAMGFGLRPVEMSAGELKNIYIGSFPVTASDEGVNVRPVPALGPGWFLARVPLNPASLQWYTHKPDGSRLPLETPAKFYLYACRPWLARSGIPMPHGKPSSLHIAAVSLEESKIDLILTGNGLGNVFCKPETPKILATLRNLTGSFLSVTVRCELIPFDGPKKTKQRTISLKPASTLTLDALAAPVSGLGHYRVRVVADAGKGCRIDYRTNLALLAPDTRKKIDSPFGIWPELWGDNATETQRSYLKEKAGVGFYYGKDHYDYRMGTPVPDDATAETIARQIPPKARIFMLGWECVWTMEQTFAFPGIISDGQAEQLPAEKNALADKTAEEWRHVAKAVRALRPDVKISLGNSAVNFSVPFLERGFKHGVEFDYFGTEEGLFDELPEQPADAIGNINWWTKAVCDHYGFHDVPIFHSESVYYPTGPGFSRMSARTQAANYVREFILGFPYNSIFGFSGAIVDSDNQYVYSIWGTAGYCNASPECSPKPSYVAYATLTQMLDGAKYDGMLDTGTTSVYAMRFRRQDGSFIYALWNLRGSRKITLTVASAGDPCVVDAFNRPVPARIKSGKLDLTISDLPVYVTGVILGAITPGKNVPEPEVQGTIIARLDSADDWSVDTAADSAFEAPRVWRGMPKVKGDWSVRTAKIAAMPGMPAAGQIKALSFTLVPQEKPHGLIPRYVSLSIKTGKEIPIPEGTTRLGLWLYGRSTWAQVKIGVKDKLSGRSWLILEDDTANRMADNFDGWRFVDTGNLGEDIANGSCVINRIVVTMPQQQVYVKDLRTTANPSVAIAGITAFKEKIPPYNYLPW